MAGFVHQRWISEAASGLPRAERQSCEYDAYVPDLLADRTFTLSGEVAADVADAEAALTRLDARVSGLTNTETLARLLLRAESVASSRIEGLEIGSRRLISAEVARQAGESPADLTAEEVLGNIDAMRAALSAAENEERITTDTLLRIHRCLLENTRLSAHGGSIREVQNWVGGNRYNPCSAAYVPPPPDSVPELLADLADFCNSDMLPAVVQAAVAHAQFETIHPFADGNGRTGRALVHLILRRRGIATRVQPPISLILATRGRDYIHGLTVFRYPGAPDSAEALSGFNDWAGIFAVACVRAVHDAESFEDRCAEIESEWRSRLSPVRRDSSVDLLLRMLPGTPIVSVKSAIAEIGRSKPQVGDAIARLVDARVLAQVTVGRRNRAFEAREVIDAFQDLERRLASASGDTRIDPPSRPVPGRRQ